MKIDYSLTEEELSGIDASGPLVMVAFLSHYSRIKARRSGCAEGVT
jgi:hypothetical protein